MEVTRLKEDFEGLTPEQQMEFMAGVGPAFCRAMMKDPARRRAMMSRCLRADGCSVARMAATIGAAGITLTALLAGIRAAVKHLTHSPASPEAS